MTPRAAREQNSVPLNCSLARPGPARSLHHVDPHELADRPAVPVTLLESLLDHEVSFAVTPPNPESEELLLRLTGAHHADLRVADYILAGPDGISAALEQANEGKPEYPDWGATIIAMVDSVSAEPGAGDRIVLSGPGILDRQSTWVEGFQPEARAAFLAKNSDLPLGVDLVLVAPDGAFTCLPRYTEVQEGR